MAILIEPSGKLTTVKDVHTLWYDGARDMMGGPADIIDLDDGRGLIVNEEFAVRKLAENVGATSILQETLAKRREGISTLLAPELSADRKILGPAILLESAELKKIKKG